MGLIALHDILEFSKKTLLKVGVPEQDAAIIADTILDAHKKGRHTHGISRLPIYVRKIREGLMSAITILTPIQSAPIVSVYDAQNGFGQVAAYKGMIECVEKAKANGVGIVAIKDSNSFGIAGYYGNVAAEHGVIGIVMGNASPALAPPGGSHPVLGTNPICFAFPGTSSNKHIIFDMACSVAARGKIRLAAKNGGKIPLDWARNVDGNPTDDPIAAIEGTLNAIGGYKGFGLALVVDILAGLLTGSAFGGDVKPLNALSGFSRYGHFLVTINPEFFLTKEEYEKRIDYLISQIKSCGNAGEVLMPGENGYAYESEHPESVEISDIVISDINLLAESTKVSLRLIPINTSTPPVGNIW